MWNGNILIHVVDKVLVWVKFRGEENDNLKYSEGYVSFPNFFQSLFRLNFKG